jgi:ankyrin repeat protein
MAKPKIDAKEALDDIRAGMDAVALMQKYSLSPRGLQSLFGKLSAEGLVNEDLDVVDDWRPPGGASTTAVNREKKEVSAKSVWLDLKTGLSDNDLMEKYKLSPKGLFSLFNKIMDAGFIKEYELEQGKPSLKRKVKNLLDAGGDVNHTFFFGCTLLNAAAGAGQETVAQVLLSRGAAVDAPSKNGETALMKACRTGNDRVVLLLLDRGADVNAADGEGLTALMFAAATGDEDLVQLLLDRGAHPNSPGRNGVTALMMASNEGYHHVVRILLDCGADIDARESEGITALMMAAHEGHKDVLDIMLARNPQILAKDDSGKTASMWAHQAGHREIALLLMKAARKQES